MKLAIVTGGAFGIGYEISKSLSKIGYKVLVFDIKENKEKLENISFLKININDLNEISNHLKDKKIDLLINNAAIQIEKEFSKINSVEIQTVLQTNLIDTIVLTNHLLPYINNNSVIINIGSVHSIKPRLNKLTYDVSKAGLDMFTKSLALELAPLIRVNQLNIGATFTPMNDIFNDNKDILDSARSKVPLNHVFDASEIASAVIGLLSDDFKWMTGSIINYDGGRSLK